MDSRISGSALKYLDDWTKTSMKSLLSKDFCSTFISFTWALMVAGLQSLGSHGVWYPRWTSQAPLQSWKALRWSKVAKFSVSVVFKMTSQFDCSTSWDDVSTMQMLRNWIACPPEGRNLSCIFVRLWISESDLNFLSNKIVIGYFEIWDTRWINRSYNLEKKDENRKKN